MQVGIMTSLFTLGPLSFLMMPVLMIGLTERFHWSEAELGTLATIELGALAITSLSGLYWQRRWNWRVLAITADVSIIAANLASTRLSSFTDLACARFAAGLGSGILLALYFAYLPSTKRPDRNGSIATFVQVAAQVAIDYSSASLLHRWGLNGLYVLIAATASLLLPFSAWIPTGLAPEVPAGSIVDRPSRTWGRRVPGWAGLLANALFFAAQSGIFSFFGEIGQREGGLADRQTLDAITVAAALALIGPAASYWLSRRAGFLWPILLSTIAQVVVLVVLAHGGYAYAGFLLLIAALLVLWNFAQPYVFALMVVIDEGMTVALPGAQAAGIALGPMIIGYGIDRNGIAGGTGLTLMMTLASLALFMPLCVMIRRPAATPALQVAQ
jgi:predicted MFS family arabinose efflux permease